MDRRDFTCWIVSGLAAAARAAAQAAAGLRGKLITGANPALETAGGAALVRLTGDKGTLLVLADERLKGADFEVVGASVEPGLIRVDPLHKRAMFVHQGGKRLMITYWCEVCSIRTFTPGVCMCCQDETALDLKEKLESDDLKTR